MNAERGADRDNTSRGVGLKPGVRRHLADIGGADEPVERGRRAHGGFEQAHEVGVLRHVGFDRDGSPALGRVGARGYIFGGFALAFDGVDGNVPALAREPRAVAAQMPEAGPVTSATRHSVES